MSSFSLQNSQLRAALVSAGLPAAQAASIANILGNAAQEMRHAGEVTHDRTPAGMRLVDPDERKHVLTELDFKAKDPDYRKPKSDPLESRARPEQEPTVLLSVAPQQNDAAFRVAGGAYTTANAVGQAARVDLNMRVDGPCVFVDPATNTLHGKAIRAESGGRDDGRVRFWIEDRGRESVWKLQLINVKRQDVVTGVEHQPGRGLVVTYQTIDAWAIGEPYRRLVPLPQGVSLSQPVVIGKRADGAEWLQGESAAVQPYVDGVAAAEAPIADVQNLWRYIRPDQMVAIAQADDGNWYVVESAVGCEDGMHGEDISRSGFDSTADASGVAEAASANPQVLVNDGGCARWMTMQKVTVPCADAGTSSLPIRAGISGGLAGDFRNVYVLNTDETTEACLLSSGAFSCSHGSGTVSIDKNPLVPCEALVNVSLTLNTTECPPDPPPSPGG